MRSIARCGLSRPVGGSTPQVLVISTTGTLSGVPSIGVLPEGYSGAESSSYAQECGGKACEFTNHPSAALRTGLGNVLAILSDKKLGLDIDADTLAEYYHPETMMLTDYYPFGSPLVGRSWQSGSYRYGFNGMQKDNEVVGEANAYDFGARMYDARVGRWWSVDPKAGRYLSISPFVFVLDNPIVFLDPNGKEVIATSKEAFNLIIWGLTPDEAKYVLIGDNGVIDKQRLRKGVKKLKEVGGNYVALLKLVEDDEITEVHVGEVFSVINENGEEKIINFNEFSEPRVVTDRQVMWEAEKESIEKAGKNYDWWVENYGNKYEETPYDEGFFGKTVFPGGDLERSVSGNIEVWVNPRARLQQQTATQAHETYGHDYFNSLGKPHGHTGTIYQDTYNGPLEEQIRQRTKEASENYDKHNPDN